MNKIFDIDGIKLSIPMKIFEEACRVYLMELGTDEEEIRGNYLYLYNAIVAAYTEKLEDFGKINIRTIKERYTDEEISQNVLDIIKKGIKRNGGNPTLFY